MSVAEVHRAEDSVIRALKASKDHIIPSVYDLVDRLRDTEGFEHGYRTEEIIRIAVLALREQGRLRIEGSRVRLSDPTEVHRGVGL